MSVLGSLLNVAAIGVGLLNAYVNGGQLSTPNDFQYELENGERIRILSHYVLLDTKNPRAVGKAFAGGKISREVSDGPIPTPDPSPVAGVVFTLAQNDASQNSIYAVNTTTDTDFLLAYSNTDGDGITNSPQPIVLPRATNKYKPQLLDSTTDFATFPQGNITVSNAAVATPSSVTRALQSMSLKGSPPPLFLPASTLLGNFGIPSIVASATYSWPLFDGSKIGWAWNTDSSTGEINGVTINSTATYSVSVSATLNWDNPTEAFTLAVTAAPGVSTGSFPPNNRPLADASIALIKVSSSIEEHNAYIKAGVLQQKASKRLKAVKYAYI